MTQTLLSQNRVCKSAHKMTLTIARTFAKKKKTEDVQYISLKGHAEWHLSLITNAVKHQETLCSGPDSTLILDLFDGRNSPHPLGCFFCLTV